MKPSREQFTGERPLCGARPKASWRATASPQMTLCIAHDADALDDCLCLQSFDASAEHTPNRELSNPGHPDLRTASLTQITTRTTLCSTPHTVAAGGTAGHMSQLTRPMAIQQHTRPMTVIIVHHISRRYHRITVTDVDESYLDRRRRSADARAAAAVRDRASDPAPAGRLGLRGGA